MLLFMFTLLIVLMVLTSGVMAENSVDSIVDSDVMVSTSTGGKGRWNTLCVLLNFYSHTQAMGLDTGGYPI